MTTYRRKPIEVSAIVWTGENDAEVREFVGTDHQRVTFYGKDSRGGAYPAFLGEVSFGHGGAIVKDPDGGFSVVSAAVFSRDYEAIENRDPVALMNFAVDGDPDWLGKT